MFIGNLRTFDEEKMYLPKGYEKWIQYLAELDINNLKVGKYDLDEENYMTVVEVETNSANVRSLEAHRNFADIQLVISGREKIGYQSMTQVDNNLKKETNATNDLYFYDSKSEDTVIAMTKGTYAIFSPCDAHRTLCNWGNEIEQIKKIIMKIKI